MSGNNQHTVNSKTWAVVSDIHIPYQHKPSWAAFKKWVDRTRPEGVVVNGDLFDFESISSYPKGPGSRHRVIDELKEGIAELNWLKRRVKRLVVIPGNHEARFDKRLVAAFGQALEDVSGFSFSSLLYNNGLDKSVEVLTESTQTIGFRLAQFIIRHGDKQAGKGQGKHIAYNRLVRTLGASEVVGHHHVAQMFCMSFDDRTAIAVANPMMSESHAYATGASWQRGFTILEVGPNNWATPFVVVMHDSQFCYAGRVYRG